VVGPLTENQDEPMEKHGQPVLADIAHFLRFPEQA
jgi:hypothetical protein